MAATGEPVDLSALWTKVLAEAANVAHGLHGPDHWARVERNGLYLARRTDVRETVVLLFALLHDCMRFNESMDPDHGRRAAAYAASVRADLPVLSDDDFQRLCYACEWHTERRLTDDPTIGVCWDADRLDIGRAGFTPEACFMNCEAAKEIASGGAFHVLNEVELRRI
jgi:uncharacterized protein